MNAITERVRLREAVKLYRKKLMTSVGMNKVEGSVAKMSKTLRPKVGVKKVQAGMVPKPAGMESLQVYANLMESRRTDIINRILKRIAAARSAGKSNPGSRAGRRMTDFGKAGLTVVNHHGALDLLEKPTKRNLVYIKKIMHSDRSIVGRGILREGYAQAAQEGYKRGAPITKMAADTYNKNRLITRGNLKAANPGQALKYGMQATKFGARLAKKAAPKAGGLMAQAKQAVQTGKLGPSPSPSPNLMSPDRKATQDLF